MLGFIPENRAITVFQVTLPDDYGISVEETEGTEYNCYFSFNTKNDSVLNSLGVEVVYTAKMLFSVDTTVKIKTGDKVVFTDDSGIEQKKEVIQVQFMRDFAGEVTSIKAVI